jgi:hypothetical protein
MLVRYYLTCALITIMKRRKHDKNRVKQAKPRKNNIRSMLQTIKRHGKPATDGQFIHAMETIFTSLNVSYSSLKEDKIATTHGKYSAYT